MTNGLSSINTAASAGAYAFLIRFRLLVLLLVATWIGSAAQAQQTQQGQNAQPSLSDQANGAKATDALPTRYWPTDVTWDPAVTTPQEFFGFDIGDRHLFHHQVVSYLQLLAEESPRIQIEEYGKSHGHRPLLLLTISSEENLANLDSIQAAHRRLAQGDNAGAAEAPSTKTLPAVINMGYGVHGDEPSATNVAPLVAYYLAAATSEPVLSQLKNCVILLDPCLNPDGFDRFAHWENAYRGTTVNSDPQHAEHQQPWTRGRVNYYWFDLNRDWLPLVHPESQGRMQWYHQWKPNVVLDFHEMGTNSTYFFQPGIPARTNPLTPSRNFELTQAIAMYHSAAFDKQRKLYVTQEMFDDFYMGKGSTYPDLHGCIGILFEQASSRGHVQDSINGPVRFEDTIANQWTTSRSSLQATSDLRQELLDYKRNFYRESMQLAKQDRDRFLLFRAEGDIPRLQQFAETLLRHDIQCFWLRKPMTVDQQRFSANSTLVVPMLQPEYRFIRSLFDRPTDFRENIFYDVSAWTLDLAFNLEKSTAADVPSENLRPAMLDQVRPKKFRPAETDFAYLIDYRNSLAPALLAKLLQEDVVVKVATQPFQANLPGKKRPQKFGHGTLVVPLGLQPEKVQQITDMLGDAAQRGAVVHALSTGLTAEGIDLGSNDMVRVAKPKIALVIGEGTSLYEVGAAWHAMDHLLGQPVTLLHLDDLRRSELGQYNRLVVTSGSYTAVQAELEDWVSRGGTLVALNRAATSFQQAWNPDEDSQDAGASADANQAEPAPNQLPYASQRQTRALQLISGAIFQTQVDRTHPLCYGITTSTLPVFRNHSALLEPSSSPYQNPLIYQPEGTSLMAGYTSEENQAKFAGKASVSVMPLGSGRVVLLSDDMNFRGFWPQTRRVFYNSLFFE